MGNERVEEVKMIKERERERDGGETSFRQVSESHSLDYVGTG